MMTTAILTALLTPALAHDLGADGPDTCMCTGKKVECMNIFNGMECNMFGGDRECSWWCPGDEPPLDGKLKLGGSPVGPQPGDTSSGYGSRWIPGTHAGSCFFGMCLPGLSCRHLLQGNLPWGDSSWRCVRDSPASKGGQGEACRDWGSPCDPGLECMYNRGERTCRYRLYKGSDDAQSLGAGGDPFNGEDDTPRRDPESPKLGNGVGPKLGGHAVGPGHNHGGGHPVGPHPNNNNYNNGFLNYPCIDGYRCNQGLRCDQGYYPYYQTQCVNFDTSQCNYPRDNGALGCACYPDRTCHRGFECVPRYNQQGVCDYSSGPIRPHPVGSAGGVTRRLDFAFEN